MTIIGLTLKNIKYRMLSSLLTIFSISVGVALIVVTLQVREQSESYFTQSHYGYDLILGAKGSPLQLVLNTIYHLDKPIENLPLNFMGEVRQHPQVDYVIPFSLGDNFHGFRLVGTDNTFFEKLSITEGKIGLDFMEGSKFKGKFDCVIGFDAAQKLKLHVGDEIHAEHGLEEKIVSQHHDDDEEEEEEIIGEEDEDHDPHEENPYLVSGILKKTNTPVDRIIMISYQSVLTLHDQDDSERQEITSMAVKMKSPAYAFGFRQYINKGQVAQAVLPFMEIDKLFKTVGRASQLLVVMGYLISVLACLTIFLTIYNSLRERFRSLYVLRALGAGRIFLFENLFLEGFIISGLGVVVGGICGHILLLGLKNVFISMAGIEVSGTLVSGNEILSLLVIWGIGALISVIPGILAYKTDVSISLGSS